MKGKCTYIRGGDSVPVPWVTEHAVAAGLDDEVVAAMYTCDSGDDVLDAAITAVAPCYA
jgi:hypothetical protein